MTSATARTSPGCAEANTEDSVIRIGVRIMHHPKRADQLSGLISACAPLAPEVTPDPDPDGVPSPLRTAKRAWSEIDDDATHHLVLQDDVRLTPGFAHQLQKAVAGRPDHGVSLYSHWNSPHNSYLTRRAAVAGAAYAPLSPVEWTPTQGLVLPVEHARELAAYLADIPDEVQDDDEMVVIFCQKYGIPVVATVPHLVDHGDNDTVVGHYDELRATLFTPDYPWSAGDPADVELPPGTCTVELVRSVCSVRLMSGDPVEHEFGWYWYDACPLLGLDPEEVLNAGAPYLGELPPRLVSTMTEVWAACYLLGADVASSTVSPPHRGGPLTRAAIESWIGSGLSAHDRARIVGLRREECLQFATIAVQSGLERYRRAPVS